MAFIIIQKLTNFIYGLVLILQILFIFTYPNGLLQFHNSIIYIFNLIILITFIFIYYCVRHNKLVGDLNDVRNENKKFLEHQRASAKITKILRPALESKLLKTCQFKTRVTNFGQLLYVESGENDTFELRSLFRLVKRYFYDLSFNCRYETDNSIMKTPFSLPFTYQVIFSVIDQIDKEIAGNKIIECIVIQYSNKIRVSFVYEINEYLYNIDLNNSPTSHPLFIPDITNSRVIEKKHGFEIIKYMSEKKCQIDLLFDEVI